MKECGGAGGGEEGHYDLNCLKLCEITSPHTAEVVNVGEGSWTSSRQQSIWFIHFRTFRRETVSTDYFVCPYVRSSV